MLNVKLVKFIQLWMVRDHLLTDLECRSSRLVEYGNEKHPERVDDAEDHAIGPETRQARQPAPTTIRYFMMASVLGH